MNEKLYGPGGNVMKPVSKRSRTMHALLVVLAIALFQPLFVLPDSAQTKGRDDNRSEFYGIIQSRPKDTLQGEWVIGGRTINSEPDTEFDETEGKLTVGSCAKVDLRNGKVHEIDSEPMSDCR